jgi:hypothetical protein
MRFSPNPLRRGFPRSGPASDHALDRLSDSLNHTETDVDMRVGLSLIWRLNFLYCSGSRAAHVVLNSSHNAEIATMKKFLLVSLPLLAIATFSFTAIAQVTKGKSRPLLTKQLMSGLVAPNCKGLGAGLMEAPTDDEGWAKLATQAALLNEAGHILMADGRCPDADWAGAAKTLRECSAVVLKKIEAKDAEGAQGAFKAMTKSCAACHKAHKK